MTFKPDKKPSFSKLFYYAYIYIYYKSSVSENSISIFIRRFAFYDKGILFRNRLQQTLIWNVSKIYYIRNPVSTKCHKLKNKRFILVISYNVFSYVISNYQEFNNAILNLKKHSKNVPFKSIIFGFRKKYIFVKIIQWY